MISLLWRFWSIWRNLTSCLEKITGLEVNYSYVSFVCSSNTTLTLDVLHKFINSCFLISNIGTTILSNVMKSCCSNETMYMNDMWMFGFMEVMEFFFQKRAKCNEKCNWWGNHFYFIKIISVAIMFLYISK